MFIETIFDYLYNSLKLYDVDPSSPGYFIDQETYKNWLENLY